ncbi:hypothetical protein J437_LFUL010052 [Ladona fulva]|uniref:Uncharacterized protein n=1 Tax=Ladona fulva TaxID=123851 RepID=A0A8K0K7V4_LADFU|nr:hypothetical protein J437_LFUL010052 [Ladona fulva]
MHDVLFQSRMRLRLLENAPIKMSLDVRLELGTLGHPRTVPRLAVGSGPWFVPVGYRRVRRQCHPHLGRGNVNVECSVTAAHIA